MIKLKNVNHRHPSQKHPVLRNVNLELERGQSLALLGRSGSGKSTLLNLIAGIEPLQDGELYIDDHSMAGCNDDQRTLLRRRHMGFVYQFFNLLPTLTVAQNLSLPLELNKVARDQSEALIEQWLQRIDLQQLSENFPDTLSGGEQQRVAIARALIHQPSVLLADEPTGNLDAASGERALDLLLEGASQQLQTLILVTHSRTVAERCNRVMSLQDGELHEGMVGVAW